MAHLRTFMQFCTLQISLIITTIIIITILTLTLVNVYDHPV